MSDILKQFAGCICQGLTDHVKASEEYDSKLHKRLVSVSRALAADMSDKECVVFAALLLARHLSWIESAAEKVESAIHETA